MTTGPGFLKIFQKIGPEFQKNMLYLSLENLICVFISTFNYQKQS